MTGPNMTNSLLGVLLRFRSDKVAVIADLQQMFYSFYICEEHRDFVRFLWHKDNDLNQELVDFRMKAHVFGNSPSPAVATLGLRKTADISSETYGKDVCDFIYRNFYVDDALSSHSTCEEAISLLKRTQSALSDIGNLRLHKICSNSSDVLSAFDKSELSNDLKEMDFDLENNLPMQRSLGVSWDLNLDAFTYRVSNEDKPFTRRGVLSVVNGLYDPLGFAAPVLIGGKLLLREAMSDCVDWDKPLPQEFCTRFKLWKDSLKHLEQVKIPRTYRDGSSGFHCQDLLVFSDASDKAVAAVAYIRTVYDSSKQDIGFVMGKVKVAPKHGHTIPRLELCAAVLGVQIFETIKQELDHVNFKTVTIFTDSKVTLGYIHNETKRFFVYVRNRVDRIRSSTSPSQWKYVSSKNNPADCATRSISAEYLSESLWLTGPRGFLFESVDDNHTFELVSPDEDREIRTAKTSVESVNIPFGCSIFDRFSSWRSLVRAIKTLKMRARRSQSCNSTELKPVSNSESELLILKLVQREHYESEICALQQGQVIQKHSKISNLSPYLDNNGILRVGGRLRHAEMQISETNPVIIPKSQVTRLLVRHFHEALYHQGRQLTECAIRKAGFWLIGGKRIVSSHIFNCVKCRRLRGRQESQMMADLPFERLDPAPPFTYIGIDVFGPWIILTRKTRGGLANSKRWAVMFTCLVVRAVHVEIIEEMSSSCFINALRRFCAIRGEVRIIRSDCGTNFVGSVKDLNASVINLEDRPVKQYLTEKGINWVFNPPHSSHMGGSWERMIGTARRILDSILLGVKQLTHEMLTTIMAEVSAIINARPLVLRSRNSISINTCNLTYLEN